MKKYFVVYFDKDTLKEHTAIIMAPSASDAEVAALVECNAVNPVYYVAEIDIEVLERAGREI